MADVVIDASVWVSRQSARDPHHEPTVDWFQHQTGALQIAPILMLAEVAGALSRITGMPRIGHDSVQHLLRLPTLRLVPLDAPLGERAVLVAAELGLRGADAVYVAVAERLGLPLVTWDDDQRRRASRLISVRRPH